MQVVACGAKDSQKLRFYSPITQALGINSEWISAMLFSIIKFASIALTGFIGIWSLLHDYKDENGKVKKSGKIALTLIVLSTCLTAVMQILEMSEKERAAIAATQRSQESIQRMEGILTEVNRAVHSFELVEATYNLNFPQHSTLDELSDLISLKAVQTLDNAPPNAIHKSKHDPRINPIYRGDDMEIILKRDIPDSPSSISLSTKSKIFKELSLSNDLKSIGWARVIVEFYPGNIDVTLAKRDWPDPLLQIWFVSGSCSAIGHSGNDCDLPDHTAELDIDEKEFGIEGKSIQPHHLFNYNGDIVSLSDLVSTQMVLSIETWSSVPESINEGIYPGRFYLDFGKGRSINVTSSLEKLPGSSATYTVRLPDSVDELLKLR